MMDEIRILAIQLSHDVGTLEGWAIELIDVDPGETDEDGNFKYEKAIKLSIEGRRRLQLEFFKGEDMKSQILEGVNQLQDVIVETSLKAWPQCPCHEHVLVPESNDGELRWVCPVDRDVWVALGKL